MGSWNTEVSRYAVLSASGTASNSGNNMLITPSSGKRVRVNYCSYNPLEQVEAAFRFGAAGPLFLKNEIKGYGIVSKEFGSRRFIEGNVDEPLNLVLGANVATNWSIFYEEVS